MPLWAEHPGTAAMNKCNLSQAGVTRWRSDHPLPPYIWRISTMRFTGKKSSFSLPVVCGIRVSSRWKYDQTCDRSKEKKSVATSRNNLLRWLNNAKGDKNNKKKRKGKVKHVQPIRTILLTVEPRSQLDATRVLDCLNYRSMNYGWLHSEAPTRKCMANKVHEAKRAYWSLLELRETFLSQLYLQRNNLIV